MIKILMLGIKGHNKRIKELKIIINDHMMILIIVVNTNIHPKQCNFVQRYSTRSRGETTSKYMEEKVTLMG